MTRTTRLAAVFAAAAIAAIPASAATWQIDPAHSGANFSLKHMMISTVRGDFSKVTGTVEYDGKDVSTIKADVTIDASTVDTRDAKRDEHIKGADFLDVAKFPTITFKSKKVVPAGPGKLQLVGDLTIHGVSKEVALDVEGPTPEVKDPWGNLRTAASGTVKINRQDFGVKWNMPLGTGGLVVSNEVAITFDLEVIRKADAAPAAK